MRCPKCSGFKFDEADGCDDCGFMQKQQVAAPVFVNDGSEADLVATAANAVYNVTQKSTHFYKLGLEDAIVCLIRHLAGETEDIDTIKETAEWLLRMEELRDETAD